MGEQKGNCCFYVYYKVDSDFVTWKWGKFHVESSGVYLKCNPPCQLMNLAKAINLNNIRMPLICSCMPYVLGLKLLHCCFVGDIS